MVQITRKNYADFLAQLDQGAKVSFYELFAHNLTVICRDVWSDEMLDLHQKVTQMKWINEILH